MISIRNILVPVDLSRGSAEALEFALALRRGDRALAAGARLHVVHAVDLALAVTARSQASRSLAAVEADALRRFARELAGEVETDMVVEVVDGEAHHMIPELAAAHDLVVIGARSEPHAGDLVPGGVAEAVVRRSSAPVVTVKWLTGISPLERGQPLSPREIVFATDFTSFSAQALRYALAIAFAHGAHVTALHVVPDARELRESPRMPFPLSSEIDRFYETELSWQRDELGRFLRDRIHVERPVTVRESVRAGDPAEEIAAECLERGADLLVMATHGERGLAGRVLGSTAEKALRLAPCPVLTVRPRAG